MKAKLTKLSVDRKVTQNTRYKCERCEVPIEQSPYIEVHHWNGERILKTYWHLRCRELAKREHAASTALAEPRI